MNLPRPRHIHVERRSDTLYISWRWFTPRGVWMALLALTWLAGIIVWRGVAADTLTIPALVLALPITFGIAMTYSALTELVNTTMISVSPTAIIVHHGPLPVPGRREASRESLCQLYCVEHDAGADTAIPPFQLCAKYQDGSTVVLVKRLARAEHALYLEQAIEAELHIADALVDGELKAAWRQHAAMLVVE